MSDLRKMGMEDGGMEGRGEEKNEGKAWVG